MNDADGSAPSPMETGGRGYDRSALLLAWLEARRHASSHPTLRVHHTEVYEAFRKSFGIDLGRMPKGLEADFEMMGLHSLFLATASSYEAIRSPFANYLCAPGSVAGFYQLYRSAIDKTEAPLRKLYLRLMLELIESMWGETAPRSVSREQLLANGFPKGPVPDPVDFW